MYTHLKVARVRLGFFLVVLLCGVCVRLEATAKSVSFGIFEIVDCSKTGAKKMQLQRAESTEKYCLSAKPIVTRTHLKDAKSGTDSLGRPMLELTLTEHGGELMAETTEQMTKERWETDQLRSLGLVVDGRLVAVAKLTGVIKDQLIVDGSFTRDQVDEMVALLMGRPAKAPPGVRKT